MGGKHKKPDPQATEKELQRMVDQINNTKTQQPPGTTKKQHAEAQAAKAHRSVQATPVKRSTPAVESSSSSASDDSDEVRDDARANTSQPDASHLTARQQRIAEAEREAQSAKQAEKEAKAIKAAAKLEQAKMSKQQASASKKTTKEAPSISTPEVMRSLASTPGANRPPIPSPASASLTEMPSVLAHPPLEAEEAEASEQEDDGQASDSASAPATPLPQSERRAVKEKKKKAQDKAQAAKAAAQATPSAAKKGKADQGTATKLTKAADAIVERGAASVAVQLNDAASEENMESAFARAQNEPNSAKQLFAQHFEMVARSLQPELHATSQAPTTEQMDGDDDGAEQGQTDQASQAAAAIRPADEDDDGAAQDASAEEHRVATPVEPMSQTPAPIASPLPRPPENDGDTVADAVDIVTLQLSAGNEAALKARQAYETMIANTAAATFGMSSAVQRSAAPAALAAAASPPPQPSASSSYLGAVTSTVNAKTAGASKPKPPQYVTISPDLAAQLSNLRADGKVKHLPPQQDQQLLVGNKETAYAGHEAMIAYDLHNPLRTVKAMMEAAAPWLKVAILRAATVIMVTREKLGRPSFLLLGGVKSASCVNHVKFDESKVRVIDLHPLKEPPRQEGILRVSDKDKVKSKMYRLVGKKEDVLKFARDFKVSFVFERNFERDGKTQSHVVCSLSNEKVLEASKTLLTIPEECVCAEEAYSRMVVVDFLKAITAEKAFDFLMGIQKSQKAATSLVTFKGRICFPNDVTQEQLAKLKKEYAHVAQNVRCPALGHVTLNRHAQTIADEDDVAVAAVPESHALGSEVITLGVWQNTSWLSSDMVSSAMSVIKTKDPKAVVLHQDGRFANISIHPSKLKELDNVCIDVGQQIMLKTASLKALKAAKEALEKRRAESVAKAKAQQVAAAPRVAAPSTPAKAPAQQSTKAAPAVASVASGMALTPPAPSTSHGS